ncbi:Thioesterase domain protein [Corynebacterium felinum]|nr:Thioesterase domain protein [Corynebacterium felinum]
MWWDPTLKRKHALYEENAPKMSEIQPAQTPLENTLILAWEKQLGITPICRTDRPEDLGATSLDVESVIIHLQHALGRDLPLELFAPLAGESEAPRIHEVAQRIEQHSKESFTTSSPTCTHLTPGNDDKPLALLFVGAGATGVCYRMLARELSGSFDCWAFHAHGFLSRGIPDWTVRAHVKRHLTSAREHIPQFEQRLRTTPATVIGHSFGGYIAIFASFALEEQGFSPKRTVILDSVMARDGVSVADFKTHPHPQEAEKTQSKKRFSKIRSVVKQLRTHVHIYTAGIIMRDVQTQQHIFWEQAVRIQNRTRLSGVPAGSIVVITDDNKIQQPLWEKLDPAPQIVHVGGDHLSVLRDMRYVPQVASIITGD